MDDVIVRASWADPSPESDDAGISVCDLWSRCNGRCACLWDIQLTTGASAMPASVGFRILGAAGSDRSGYSVSAAGDVNGDGVDDVMSWSI